jgi:phage-related holin
MSILAELIVELRILLGLNLRTPWYALCAILGFTTAGVLEFTDTYLWSPPITLLLVFLTIMADSATGMLYAYRQRRWESRKAFRGLFKAVAYLGLLILAHNYGRAEPSLSWLPTGILVPMVLFLVLSLIKNLSLLGWLPPKLAGMLYERIDAYKNPASDAPEQKPHPQPLSKGDGGKQQGYKPGRSLLLLLCAGLLLSSCTTEKSCRRRYPCTPSAVERLVTVRDTTILTPAATVEWVLMPCADIAASGAGKAPDAGPFIMTVPMTPPRASGAGGPGGARPGVVADTTGQAQLSWHYDAQGRLHIQCACKPVPHTIRDAIRHALETRTLVQTERVYGFWWWSGVVGWILVALAIVLTIYKRLKPL